METKTLGVVDVKVKAAGDGFGEWEAVLSAPTLDRDGEVIDAGAFEPLPDRIPIDVDHDMTVASTIGSGVPFYDGDLLKIRGQFSSIPRAQEVRTLVTEGHVNKMSVTFMDALREDDDDGKVHIRRAELLNAAFVPIPSNREATVLAAKSMDVATAASVLTRAGVTLTQEQRDAVESLSPPADPEAAGASPEQSGDAPAPPAHSAGAARLAYTRALADAASVA